MISVKSTKSSLRGTARRSRSRTEAIQKKRLLRPFGDRNDSGWKFIDRNYKDLAVLIPGWATDHRIFGLLNLEFNYLVPLTFCPDTFEKNLLKTLKENNISKVSLFGWSLGAFLASLFASKHKHLIDKLILVSVRKRYDRGKLSEIKMQLGKNKRGFLYKFYTRCFFNRENMRWFRENLLKTYCEELDLDYLMDSLDYLQNAEMRPELLRSIKNIKIIHGECDRIAPIQEALEIKKNLPHAEFISVEQAGHIPFLEGSWQPLPATNGKDIIKKNFSKYARYYDNYSKVQDFCGLKLIKKLESGSFNSILDVGCGTGNYTRLLREKFPIARMKAMDISGEMIEAAKKKLKGKNIEFIAADANSIHLAEQFDFISSNASFQWFENLEKSLREYRDLLRDKGVILFSIFGPRTFYELDNTLKELFGNGISISSYHFMGMERIKNILQGLFEKVEIEEKLYKKKYNSLSELLEEIRYTGTRGNGIMKKGFWTPKTIDNLEKLYRKQFNYIVATYQIFFCKGEK